MIINIKYPIKSFNKAESMPRLSNNLMNHDISKNSNINNPSSIALGALQRQVNQEVEPGALIAALNSQVAENIKTNLDKELFAHIHADHAITRTSLEGGNLVRNAEFISACLDLIDVSVEIKKNLKTAFNSLISCEDPQITSKVKELIPGQSLLVSGGYQDPSGGACCII